MLERRKPPALCRTMLDVRSGVDQIDREIVERLGERFRYMEAAARLKPGREKVRDEARKAEVLARVRDLAAAHGVPEHVAADLYEQLVEASIAYELDRFDEKTAITS